MGEVKPMCCMSERPGTPLYVLEGNGSRESHQGPGYAVGDTMYTLNTVEQHAVCYAIDQQGGKSNCGFAKDVMVTLCSDSHGTPHAICYAIEGHVVDRNTRNNGKGWCTDVSPTLNTQDRHAVCYEGNDG